MLRSLLRRGLLVARASHILLSGRGHHRHERGAPLDADGRPIPWLTYGAIDFLERLELSGARVFEFGTGSSTRWFLARGAEVHGVETDEEWLRALPRSAQVTLCTDLAAYPEAIMEARGPFDIILVDGPERRRSAAAALAHLAEGGLIVLDNADWYPNTATDLRAAGLTQIDFTGFTPLNAFTAVTSVFFRDRIGLAYKPAPPPPGGKAIHGVDDR